MSAGLIFTINLQSYLQELVKYKYTQQMHLYFLFIL